jgi:hypothetical protein
MRALILTLALACQGGGHPLPFGYRPDAITVGKYEVVFGGNPRQVLDLREDGKVWYRDQWARWQVHYTKDNFPVLTLRWRGMDWAYRDLGYDSYKEYRLHPDGHWWKGETEFSKEYIEMRRVK